MKGSLELLAKVLFPSWNFFSAPGDASVLVEVSEDKVSWEKLWTLPRTPTQLFHNPWGNLALKLQSELEGLLERGIHQGSRELNEFKVKLFYFCDRSQLQQCRFVRIRFLSVEEESVLFLFDRNEKT